MQTTEGTDPPMNWSSARECLGPDGRLSVVLPAYRLGDSIVGNIRRVHDVFCGRIPFEIIPVDDGSGDGTAARLRAIADELPEIHPVYLPENMGKGAALREGASHATGNFILLLDGDLDLPPEPVALFFEILRRDSADIVIGSKMHPDSRVDYPWRRRLASRVYYGLVKLLVGLPVRDTQTGMKLFRAEALHYAFNRMLAKRFAFDLEVLAIAHRAGYRVAEAPVQMSFGNKIGCLTAANVRQTMNDTLAVFYRLRVLKYYDSLIALSPPVPPPPVTAVIACPGASAFLDDCLAGLARQNYRALDVIILPDAPTGRSWPANVREIPTGPVRPAEKRNLGIAEALGEIIAFVDDDAVPLSGWLQRAVMYFGDPGTAGVGGPATTPPDDPYWAQLGGRVYAHPFVSGGYRRRYVPTRVCLEEDIPSCNLLVRTEVLRRLGGFDTTHWPGEDTLLCQAIVHDLKLRLLYDPWVQVHHHRRPLFGPHLRQVGRYALHRGVFAKHFPKTSRKLAYMLPSLLLLGLVFGPLVSLLHPWLAGFYVVVAGSYAALVLISSIHLRRPDVWLFTALGVVATHLTYGACFLQGLLGARTPEEVRPFDHQG